MTRRKFKVGDKVVAKVATVANGKGYIGTVTDYYDREYKVKFTTGTAFWFRGVELDAYVEEPKKEVKKKEPKFKVGDRVKIICTDYGATGAVIGDTGTIVGIKDTDLAYTVKFDKSRGAYHTASIRGFDYPDYTCYYCSSKMLEKIEEPKNNTIVIYQKDRAVVAHDKATGKKCYAHCHPDDKFDFKTGAKIAFDRLMGRCKIVKQDKYKVGDKVKIVDEWCEGCYPNPDGAMDKYLGTVMTIRSVDDGGCGLTYHTEEGGFWHWWPNAIEGKVVESAEEVKKEEPPKYLEKFEEGKTYIFDKHIFEEQEGYCPSWATESDGKVVKVKNSLHGEIGVFGFCPWWCRESEYYNGKVVCVDEAGFIKGLTIGKIYTFIDGECKTDDGVNMTGTPVTDVTDLNARFCSIKFIEVVE